MKIVSAHQPEAYPWLGYFNKLWSCDVFVLLDDVQYSKGSFMNRNMIANGGRDSYLTISLPKGSNRKNINEVVIDNSFIDKHIKTITQYYSRSEFKQDIIDFTEHMKTLNCSTLAEFNYGILRYFKALFGIETPILLSSELNLKGKKSDLILDLCILLDATCYLSGVHGRDYLNTLSFYERGIEIRYPKIQAEYYSMGLKQNTNHLSIIDVLASIGVERTNTLIHRFQEWKTLK